METEMPQLATIALTEKKVDMALDDIIKLSKIKTNVNKGKNPRREKKKTQYFNGVGRNDTFKVRHHMNSLSAIRQGAVAKRRSNFQGTQFPLTINTVRKAATAPQLTVRVRAFNGGRRTTANQSRRIAPPVQNRFVPAKVNPESHDEVDEKIKNRGWMRETLDSRFASMKKQRKTTYNKVLERTFQGFRHGLKPEDFSYKIPRRFYGLFQI